MEPQKKKSPYLRRIAIIAGTAVMVGLLAIWWLGNRLAPVSATAPSEDPLILEPPTVMTDGSPIITHVMQTIDTGEAMVSFGGVGGVSTDRFGNVFSTNFDSSVWRISNDGGITLLSGDFVQASGNLALPNGDLLQSDYKENKLYRVKPNGMRSVFSENGLNGPVGLVQRKSGEFIVANYRGGFLAVVPENGGDARTILQDDRFSKPNGVTRDNQDNIYIADLESPIVFRWNKDGSIDELAALPGKGNAHNVVANGVLYVNKIWDHAVYRVELDTGNYGIVAGNGRAGYQDGPTGTSTVEEPNGIAVASDGRTVYLNTHRGTMGGTPGYIVLRRLTIAQ